MTKGTARKGRAKTSPRSVAPGSWEADIVGISAVHFGQEVQDGPPRHVVEFSYVVLSAVLKGEWSDLRWPASVLIVAPTTKMTAQCDAGYLHQVRGSPLLNMSLHVTRPQYSDMLRSFERGLPNGFYFTLEDGVDGVWPVRSWGFSTRIFERHSGVKFV